ncbi:prenyltransferase [Botrimarina colliarenosi]|uniref:Prenyltransferase n=1 Tax=Botrimarina colliarenosi TaxID=2528001 RepID=A0A5C6AMY4_9BACT|nr:UbiA family prenyltransferase [Botrimarina colliarenosi]TWT99523.1 prenyltransferase [Botrimarina colliarenosi]
MVQRIAAYAKLLRLSNGPTAMADVWMGYAVASGSLEPTLPLALMTVCSLCLYHGGMALNDVRDAEQDALDNRGRPIAAGLISYQVAKRVAQSLLLTGMAFGITAGCFDASYEAVDRVLLLLVAIVAYNSQFKRTVFGPILMALCRVLNVSLGVAAVSADLRIPQADSLGVGIFFYVCGLTLYARREVIGGKRSGLVFSLLVTLMGVFFLGCLPQFDILPLPRFIGTEKWNLTWAVVALIATRGMVAGVLQPTPKKIGRGVGIAIQGLVVIDATLATFYAGPMAGLAILALLPVTMLLARWIPQT